MKNLIVLMMIAALSAPHKQTTVDLITISNAGGMTAKFTPYGARLVSLQVPDKNDRATDVVWGFDDVAGYRNCTTDPYYGAVIGRYANRIGGARFSLGGKSYRLDKNDHGNSLHGGNGGLHTKEWDISLQNDSSVTFSCLSKDREGGYPGNLRVTVTYTMTSNNALKIDYRAATDQATVINLTNHTYWNLNGPGNGDITKHFLMIRADRYTQVDSLLIPTGKISSVSGTPFDFHYSRKIGIRINDHHAQLHNGKGYDHNFVLKPHGINTPVARVTGDQSGISMDVFTDEPGLQFYSGNFMAGRNVMNGGIRDLYRSGFCLETQHFPDSPNEPRFPSTMLKPGQVYRSRTIYKFYAQ